MKNIILKILIVILFILFVFFCQNIEFKYKQIKNLENKCKISLELIENQDKFNTECKNIISSYEYLGDEINIYLKLEKNEEYENNIVNNICNNCTINNYYGNGSNYFKSNFIQNIEKINIYLDYENKESRSEIELDLEKNKVFDVNFYVQNGKNSITKINVEKNEKTSFNVHSDGIVNIKKK